MDKGNKQAVCILAKFVIMLEYEPHHEKNLFRVCDRVRHKPACTAKEAR